MRLALPRRRLGRQAANFPYYCRQNRSSHCSAIRVKPWGGNTDTIAVPRHRREISQDHDEIVGVLGAPHERDDAVVDIVKVDPVESLPS